MNTMDLVDATLWIQRLLGAGLVIQSAELLKTRGIYKKGGALEGNDVTPWLALRIGLASTLIVSPLEPLSWAAAIVHAVLLGNSIWLTMRSRGPVCGGSDSMFFQVQLGLLIASCGFLEPVLIKLGLGWIVAQSVLSYLLAGVSKLRTAGWWNGRALQSLLTSDGPYRGFAPARKLASSRPLCAVVGGGIMLFELLLPAVLILPTEGKLVLLAAGCAFHIANALVLGLNRFVWAWVATYPAILAMSR